MRCLPRNRFGSSVVHARCKALSVSSITGRMRFFNGAIVPLRRFKLASVHTPRPVILTRPSDALSGEGLVGCAVEIVRVVYC